MDQVGVKAPGKPTNKIDLSLAKSAKLCFSGGNPRCSSTLGNRSPTEANPRRDEADDEEILDSARGKALPTKSDMFQISFPGSEITTVI